jgi:hypothetical protein
MAGTDLAREPDELEVAKAMGPGTQSFLYCATVGARYASKLLNPGFLREKGCPGQVVGLAVPVPSEGLKAHPRKSGR